MTRECWHLLLNLSLGHQLWYWNTDKPKEGRTLYLNSEKPHTNSRFKIELILSPYLVSVILSII